jgi:DNA-binding transcriptional LysR family regulator
MDSDALETFMAVQRSGGFSAAAEALNRSQPAISRRIALLEAELGVPLFERIAGGGVLSQAGQVLLPHAERVLAALRDASAAIRDLRLGHAGPVSVAAVGTLAGVDLTTTLRRFSVDFPDVGLSIRTATSDEVSDLVRRGEVTIGLRYFDNPSPDLVCRPLPAERMVVVCSTSHDLAAKSVRSLGELRAQHWLAFPRNPARREAHADTIFAQFLIRDIPDIRWAPVDSLTAQKRLIEAGFGIALMPESGVAEERAAKTLDIITVEDLDVAIPISAIVRKDGYLSAASLGLLRLLAPGPL